MFSCIKMYIYNILDYTHAGSLLNVCPNNTWTGKTKYFIVHCTQSVLCAGIRKMRPVYYLINVVALALAVVAAAVYNASFFRTGKFTKDPHPPQYIRQSLNVHTADATLEQIHSDETDVFSQEHAAQTLEYDGVVWKTPTNYHRRAGFQRNRHIHVWQMVLVAGERKTHAHVQTCTRREPRFLVPRSDI